MWAPWPGAATWLGSHGGGGGGGAEALSPPPPGVERRLPSRLPPPPPPPPAQAEPQTLLGPSKGMRTSTWPSGGPKGPSLSWPPTCATLPSGKDQVTCHVRLCDRRANPGSEPPHRPLGPPGGEGWGGLGSCHLCPVGRSWRAGASKPPHHLGTGSGAEGAAWDQGGGGGVLTQPRPSLGDPAGVCLRRGGHRPRGGEHARRGLHVCGRPHAPWPQRLQGPIPGTPAPPRPRLTTGPSRSLPGAVKAARAPRGQAACRGSHWAGPSLLQPRQRPGPSGPAPPPGRGRGHPAATCPGRPPSCQGPPVPCPPSVLWTPVRHLARPPQLQPPQGCRARAAQRGPWGRSLSPAGGPSPFPPPPTSTPSSGWGEGGPCAAAP